MPISSRMRMAPSWIAATPSSSSGSVGRSGLTGIRQGDCAIAWEGRTPGLRAWPPARRGLRSVIGGSPGWASTFAPPPRHALPRLRLRRPFREPAVMRASISGNGDSGASEHRVRRKPRATPAKSPPKVLLLYQPVKQCNTLLHTSPRLCGRPARDKGPPGGFEPMLQKRNTPEAARAKPAAFAWDDPFLIDDQLTDEERMIRDAARDYCQDKLASRVLEANRHETFDRAIMDRDGRDRAARPDHPRGLRRRRRRLRLLRPDRPRGRAGRLRAIARR